MSYPSNHLPPNIVHVADVGALLTLIGSYSGLFPAIAAGLAAIWYIIQIYDRFFNN